MAYWPVFDEFRKSFFIGELVWNFADFETSQGVDSVIIKCVFIIIMCVATGRVDGNRKGILTRQRQPKFAAHVVKERYLAILQGQEYYHSELISPN